MRRERPVGCGIKLQSKPIRRFLEHHEVDHLLVKIFNKRRRLHAHCYNISCNEAVTLGVTPIRNAAHHLLRSRFHTDDMYPSILA